MIEHGSEKDILGRTYEYCLSMFAEQEGKRGGEFFTPSCVVRTLVEVLKPFKGCVYDKSIAYLIQANGKEKSSKALDIRDFEDFSLPNMRIVA